MVEIEVETRERVQWIDVSDRVAAALQGCPAETAVLCVYCPHTTAGVTVNEGWDPEVAGDAERALRALVPDVPFRHAEGNSPAHLLATLTGAAASIPVEDRRLRLGRWQRVFFCEYDGPRRRRLWLQPLAGA